MKALIYNDLKTNYKQFIACIIISFAPSILKIEGFFMLFYLIVMILFCYLNFFKEDYKTKWEMRIQYLPVSSEKVVLSKYIISLMYISISFLSLFLSNNFFGKTEVTENLLSSWIYVLILILNLAFFIPNYYKYSLGDSNRGDMIFEYFMTAFLVVFVLSIIYGSYGRELLERYQFILLIISTIIATLIYLNSFHRSVRNLKNKDFS